MPLDIADACALIAVVAVMPHLGCFHLAEVSNPLMLLDIACLCAAALGLLQQGKAPAMTPNAVHFSFVFSAGFDCNQEVFLLSGC